MPLWMYIAVASYFAVGFIIVLSLRHIDPEHSVAMHGIITWGYYFVFFIFAAAWITSAYCFYRASEVVFRAFGKEIEHCTYADFW